MTCGNDEFLNLISKNRSYVMLLCDNNLFWHSIPSKFCNTKGLEDGSLALQAKGAADNSNAA